MSVRPFDACAIVTLHGISPLCAGVERRFLAPFDRFAPLFRRVIPRRVGRTQWRRALRGAIAGDVPPGGLRETRYAEVDLLRYQLEPALAFVRGLGCRALLADEVGLGKTVQAALVVSELRARGVADRVLVIAPAGLRDQWQGELRDRFAVSSRIVDAPAVRDAAATLPPDVDPWSTFGVAIASVDYVKRPDVLASVAQKPWDVVIVDEAHGVASDSDRRAAVEALCARAAYVLLLTATPHNGDAEAFTALCRLGRVADDRLLVFRRTRHDAAVDGRRRVRTLFVRPTRAERRLHAALRRFGDAVVAERPYAWLALSVLHKRALSSAASLADSVEHRLRMLEGASVDAGVTQLALPLERDGEATRDDEPPRWDEGVALTNTERERRLLSALARAALDAAKRESKVAALARLLRRVREPVLVFTEYRDTLRHLQRALRRSTIVLHGGLSRQERRAAVEAFTRSSDAVMLATDAAGEGLNLHSGCRLVVNLELPWNPVRLEQRIGRVDRIGQRRTVHALHFIARRTGEAALLDRLRARLARAASAIGAPDPLGADEERASAEIVVLRRAATERARPAGRDVSDLWSPDLSDAACAETARLVAARQLGRCRGLDDPAMPWAIRARGRLRPLLGGRRLEVWRFVADAHGRRYESVLFGVLVEPRAGQQDVARVLDEAAQSWRSASAESAAAFSTARLERSIAVLALDDRAGRGSEQPRMFGDRRRLREQMLTASERQARRGLLERRVADARAGTSLVFRPPELLFVVLPR